MIEKFNTDRLEIIDQIHETAIEKGFNISKEQIAACIEEFEAIAIIQICRSEGILYKFRINGVCDIFTKAHGRRSRNHIILSKTFEEIVAQLFK